MNPTEILQRFYDPQSALYQLLYEHSRAVTDRALTIGKRLGADLQFIEEAGMLHDIGIYQTHAPGIHCEGSEPYIKHGIIGRALLEELGYPRHALVCERHVGTGLTIRQIERTALPLPARDMRPQTIEEEIVCYADKFYSKGSGTLSLEQVRQKLARHGDEVLEVFDRWSERFEPGGFSPTDGQ